MKTLNIQTVIVDIMAFLNKLSLFYKMNTYKNVVKLIIYVFVIAGLTTLGRVAETKPSGDG